MSPQVPKVGGSKKKFFRSLRSRTCTPHFKNCCAALACMLDLVVFHVTDCIYMGVSKLR